MSNIVTRKYFDYSSSHIDRERLVEEVLVQTGFTILHKHKEGYLLANRSKVRTELFVGEFEGTPAFLKMHYMKPEIDELAILQSVETVIPAEVVRAPRVLEAQVYDHEKGYGFLIYEQISGKPMVSQAFATDQERELFLSWYARYKAAIAGKAFFEPTSDETNSAHFMTTRIDAWKKIAEKDGRVSPIDHDVVREALTYVEQLSLSVPMEFMQGHLDFGSLFLEGDQVIMTSHSFWSYRPAFYDATFHMWASLKDPHTVSYPTEKIEHYISSWFNSYIALFPEAGPALLACWSERVCGALLIDITHQDYPKGDRASSEALLKSRFRDSLHIATRILVK